MNRLLFARVDTLFSIGSEIIKPEWLDGVDAAADADEEKDSVGNSLLTQQMADALTQKLSGMHPGSECGA